LCFVYWAYLVAHGLQVRRQQRAAERQQRLLAQHRGAGGDGRARAQRAAVRRMVKQLQKRVTVTAAALRCRRGAGRHDCACAPCRAAPRTAGAAKQQRRARQQQQRGGVH
jgi:hypothetical protein